MKVRITYYDHDSLTKEEVIAAAKHNYGDGVDVEIFPESNDALDILYFGLQQAITFDQLAILFDDGALYSKKLEELKSKLLSKVEEELLQVIKDNEIKVR